MRVARMDAGIIVEIFDGSGPINVGGDSIRFKHAITWARQQPEELTKRNLVVITWALPPLYDKQRQIFRRVLAKVGDANPQDTWEIIARPTAEARQQFINELKDRAWDLWGRASWDKNRTAWFDHRDALKVRGVALLQAYDAGGTIDIEIGSADGAGAWPV